MNKNTLTAFVLMAAVVFGFMAYENHTRGIEREEMQRMDSIARVEQAKEASERLAEAQKTSVAEADTLHPLHAAKRGVEEDIVLENEFLQLTLSTKGAQMMRAELKDSTYKGQDGGNVVLFDKGDQRMSFHIDGREANIATNELYFTARQSGADKVVMCAPIASGSLEVAYSLLPGSYVVDMSVRAVGLGDFFPTKSKTMSVTWSESMRQQEKGYDFETRYSTITRRTIAGDTEELSISGADEEESDFEEPIKWIAYKTQFFSQILIADSPMDVELMNSAKIEKGTGYLKTYLTDFSIPFDPRGAKPTAFHLYLGPNKFSTLKANEDLIASREDLDLQSLVYMGWPVIKWINRFVFLYAFDFLTSLGLNMGLVLVLLTIIVKLIVFPLMKKSYLSSANMRVLRPKVDEINARYPKKEDAMLKQQEMMRLYSEYGVSPMGGCLPMLIQMPIWIALFNFIPNYIDLRGQSFLWADDLSTYDDLVKWDFNIWGVGDHLSLFCILWCVATVASSVITQRQQQYAMTPEQQQQMGMMKWMTYLMPVIFFFSFNSYSAGLNWYYFISALTSVLMMWVLRKTTDDNKLLQKLELRHKERKAKAAAGKKTSSMMERLQAMQEKQLEILKQQEKSRMKN